MIIRIYQKHPNNNTIMEQIFGINYKVGIIIREGKPILVDTESLIFIDHITGKELDKNLILKRSDISVVGKDNNLVFDCPDWNKKGVDKILGYVIKNKPNLILKEINKAIYPEVDEILQQIK